MKKHLLCLKKALCVLSLLCFSMNTTQAQRKEWHKNIGISVSFFKQNLNLESRMQAKLPPKNLGNGFALGIFYQKRLSEFLHLRIQPEFLFAENDIDNEKLANTTAFIVPITTTALLSKKQVGIGCGLGYQRILFAEMTYAQIAYNQLFAEMIAFKNWSFKTFTLRPELVYRRTVNIGNEKSADNDVLLKNANQFIIRFVFFG